MAFSKDVLNLDCAQETERIVAKLREQVLGTLKRKGLIVALSGGIDSSVVGGLAVRAFGKEKVFGLQLPEKENSDDTRNLSALMCKHYGIAFAVEEMSALLEGARAYGRRDEAIKTAIPGYGPGWKSKIVLPSVVDTDSYRVFSVVAQDPEGKEHRARLPLEGYLGIVAATNFKQRCRKMLEYYHADRLNYAVAGTPNLVEYDQGFFVKLGDGAADVKPIAHLYKSQVYAMAEYLGVPEEVRRRPPTTDTYSLPQSQEEFYYSLPYDKMDLALYAKNHGVSAAEAGPVLGISAEQVERVYRDIEGKRAFAKYLHAAPMLVAEPKG
ncbi:MAG: NAD(+) synthase [Myxococcales bacterium]|jgi:NAD+ synthase|nr:NAD(+) synthase [Myxococcales bacterium]